MTTDKTRLDDAQRKVDDAIDALDALDESSTPLTIAIVLLTGAHILIRAAAERSDDEGA